MSFLIFEKKYILVIIFIMPTAIYNFKSFFCIGYYLRIYVFAYTNNVLGDKSFVFIKESRILYPIQIGIIASVLRPDEPNLPIQIDNQLQNYR